MSDAICVRRHVDLLNDFHNTRAGVVIRAGDVISGARLTRVRRELCGCSGCTCGDDAGTRGPQLGLAAAGLALVANCDRAGTVVVLVKSRIGAGQ